MQVLKFMIILKIKLFHLIRFESIRLPNLVGQMFVDSFQLPSWLCFVWSAAITVTNLGYALQCSSPHNLLIAATVLSLVCVQVELHDCMQDGAGQGKARGAKRSKWGQTEAWFALSLSMLSLAFRSQRPDMHTISLQSQHTECVWQQFHSHSHCHTRISISTAISMPISILHFPYCKANTNTIRQMNKHTIQLGWAADAICICQDTHTHSHTHTSWAVP